MIHHEHQFHFFHVISENYSRQWQKCYGTFVILMWSKHEAYRCTYFKVVKAFSIFKICYVHFPNKIKSFLKNLGCPLKDVVSSVVATSSTATKLDDDELIKTRLFNCSLNTTTNTTCHHLGPTHACDSFCTVAPLFAAQGFIHF